MLNNIRKLTILNRCYKTQIDKIIDNKIEKDFWRGLHLKNILFEALNCKFNKKNLILHQIKCEMRF